MSRFYYYLVFVNMIANIIASVPIILFQYHKNGAITAMLLGLVFGVFAVFIYTSFFNSYPGKALPELMQRTFPVWFTKIYLFFLAIVWFIAGMITLTTFSFLLIRYLTPDQPLWLITLSILLFVVFGCLMKTDRVLYTVEIILIISFPLIFFIFVKAYGNENLEWDFIKEAFTYINEIPHLIAFSATTYLFLGAANLVIFNRFFTQKQSFRLKQTMIISGMGTIVLFTTYFIPIGFNGFEHIETLLYPWISTSDSLRMRLGLIERVIFLFLLFYLAISFSSILIHWHVSIELLKGVIDFKKLKIKGIPVTPFIVVAFFSAISMYFTIFLNEYQLFRFTSSYYVYLVFLFLIMAIVFWSIKRRLKHEEIKKQS